MRLKVSFLTENKESIWDGVKEKLEEVRSLLQPSSIPLSSKEKKGKPNIKCNPLILFLKKKLKKAELF